MNEAEPQGSALALGYTLSPATRARGHLVLFNQSHWRSHLVRV